MISNSFLIIANDFVINNLPGHVGVNQLPVEFLGIIGCFVLPMKFGISCYKFIGQFVACTGSKVSYYPGMKFGCYNNKDLSSSFSRHYKLAAIE